MREAIQAAFARPIAHRGLHCAGGPVENTRAAARAAIAAGYGVECDVQLSRDGRAMVFHDERLDRLTGIAGALGDYDAEALGRLRLADGSPIPTLAALLATIAGRVALVIELKGSDPRLVEAVLADISGYGGPLVLESFDAATVSRCAGAACPIGLVGPPRQGDGLATIAALPRCDFLSWSVERIAEAAARRPALPLSTWTVRTPAQSEAAQRAGAQIVFEQMRP